MAFPSSERQIPHISISRSPSSTSLCSSCSSSPIFDFPFSLTVLEGLGEEIRFRVLRCLVESGLGNGSDATVSSLSSFFWFFGFPSSERQIPHVSISRSPSSTFSCSSSSSFDFPFSLKALEAVGDEITVSLFWRLEESGLGGGSDARVSSLSCFFWFFGIALV